MNSPRILIAEDENIVALNLRSVLIHAGFDVVGTVGSGSAAIDMAINSRPDLILMDIGLRRDIDGIEASRIIREQYDVPIVYLTANSDRITLDRVKDTNPYGYVLKPFDDRELHLALEMALYKHRIDRELRESRQWLSTTLHSIGDAVIATDHTGRIEFMNPVAEALTGWNTLEAAGRELTEVFRIINEYSRQTVENPVEKVLRDGGIVGLANHTILIARDGRETHIDDAAAPIPHPDGTIRGVVLTFRDITEKREAEKLLVRKERELNDFIENANVGMLRIGADGTILWANPAELEATGYAHNEYIGHNIAEFYVAPTTAGDILRRLHNNETLYNYEAQVRHRNGSVRHQSINANVLWEEGRFVYARCFTRDITALRRVEHTLRQTETDYRTVFEHTREAIVIVAADTGAVLEVNRSACELYGYTRNEFLRLTAPALWSDPEAQLPPTPVVPPPNGTVAYRTRNGRQLMLEIATSAVQYKNRPAIVAVIRDSTERQQVAQALADSEQRYRTIVENQSDFIVRWRPDSSRIYVNESYRRYFNLTADELIGSSILDQIPDTDHAVVADILRELSPDTPQVERENRILTGTGAIRWSHWITRGLFDADGRLVELLSVGRDITERKQAEQAFVEAERRYRQVLENAADFIYTTDKNGYFTYVNPAALQISGYTLEEFRQRRYLDFVHQSDRSRLALLYVRQFIERRPTMYVEFPFVTKSGTVEWLGQNSSLIIENDDVVGFHVIGRVITERRQTEQQLVESRDRIHTVLDASPFPLLISRTSDHTLLYINRRAAELFGIDRNHPGEVQALSLYQNPDDRLHLRTQVLETGYVHDLEVQLRNSSGRVFWALLSAQLLDYNGEQSLLVSCSDITARRTAEDEVRRLNTTLEERVAHRTEQLVHSNAEKDEILAVVAHDLKNPLTGIAMSAELLHRYYDRLDTDSIKKQASLILESAERMTAIISNLLDMHELDTGTLAMSRLLLADALRSLLRQYTERAAAKQIQFSSAIEEGLTLYADKTAVHRVLDNLLSNAIKFSPAHATVVMRAMTVGETVRIEVQDNGPGFQQEDIGKLFTKFARLSARPTGGEHSTGLGLSIVKKLIESMNGRVWCESEPGKGATFIMEFPKEQQAQ